MRPSQARSSSSTAMKALFVLIFLHTIFATSHASRMPIPLRLQSVLEDLHIHAGSCSSWRLAVETNNILDWDTVPKSCESYVSKYMLGGRYGKDSKVVVDAAAAYAEGLKLGGDGKDIWVFDVDETSLSNLPYYAEHGFGTELYNSTAFNAYSDQGISPPLRETVRLYKKLLSLGIKVVFLTGRSEDSRKITTSNLKNAGYHKWEKLILRDASEGGKAAIVYKSGQRKKLEEEGYRIVGNAGDQWSDLLGSNPGNRTFKMPNPMYYIG